MSTETETPKKLSFLTRAAMAVEAKKNNVETDEKILTPEEIAAKQTLRKAKVLLAGTAAVFAVTMVAIYRSAQDDETSEEETVTED